MNSKNKTPVPQKAPSRTARAMQIFDQAEPPLSVPEAARLGGVSPASLYQALQVRAQREALRCPLCNYYPGQHSVGKLWPRQGFSTTSLRQAVAEARKALVRAQAALARTMNTPVHHTPRKGSPRPAEGSDPHNEGDGTPRPP